MPAALPVFAATIFVSAFLLFLIQPMISKMILPRLGGTPQVWNTCMVFFQMALLAGYTYSHTISTRLKLRQQLLVHGGVLLLPLVWLLVMGPFSVAGWTPPPGANPMFWTIGLLALIVGLPFFVVSTSAPLLQRWFGYTGHPAAKDPYFLYGASNLGSMLALLAYPFVVEPIFSLATQSLTWAVGYGVLIVLFGACLAMVWTAPPTVHLPGMKEEEKLLETPPSAEQPIPPPPPEPAAEQAESEETEADEPGKTKEGKRKDRKASGIKKGLKHKKQPVHLAPVKREASAPLLNISYSTAPRGDEVDWLRRLRWIGLAAVPSSMMLGVTTYITTDLSPIPLFWLIPLTLYLLSFILVYMRWPITWVGPPHLVMLFVQPLAILALAIFYFGFNPAPNSIILPIVANVFGFFVTTMVCHGELATDRPGTKHLTEYYLLMSVGGMVGGMFNGLFAPIAFTYVYEFAFAIFFACLLRPTLWQGGWIDELFSGFLNKPTDGGRGQKSEGGVSPAGMHYLLDVALPVVVLLLVIGLLTALGGRRGGEGGSTLGLIFGLPLVVSCFFLGRPIRYGLAVGLILLAHGVWERMSDTGTVFADRSYFGILRVKVENTGDGAYTTLIHGHINHGMNYKRPEKKSDWGNPDADFSRLATTYYHRFGPAGVVMEKFNWFKEKDAYWAKGPENSYYADARMPASLLAASIQPATFVPPLPAAALVDLWSEPPFATIGLGTGTMASYARPFQHMHYYEIDNHVRKLSLPTGGGEPYFTYVKRAMDRGADVWILMGDARLKMAQPYGKEGEVREDGGGPENFYHMMVVDAFTSDAIPVHLITKEAIKMYFEHLTEEGVLCVHTSNRYVDLVPVVRDVAGSLNLVSTRGHDNYSGREKGHFTSEWVMVARKAEYLPSHTPPSYESSEPYWQTQYPEGRHIWTDDYSNLMAVFKGR